MVEDRKAMYDRFSEKGGHSIEWVHIMKDFLNQAFPGGRHVVKRSFLPEQRQALVHFDLCLGLLLYNYLELLFDLCIYVIGV
jgi:hypothetical protein